jgi:hypothetical protein
MLALYLTHPQVAMDPDVPVPLWGLSDEGKRRAEAFAARGVVPRGAAIFSSSETKAVELAEIIAAVTEGPIVSDHLMGEKRSQRHRLPAARAVRGHGRPLLCRAGNQRRWLGAGH